MNGVSSQPDGGKLVTFSEYSPDQMVGAHANVTFNSRGVLVAADVQWVDASDGHVVPGISFQAAMDSVGAGNGLIHTAGAQPDATSTLTGTTILYVPVNGSNGTYYEPVYRFTGTTKTGSTFEVYVPAVDGAYLR
jgi:hypothetical protein